MTRARKLGLAAVALVALAQLVRFSHENPPPNGAAKLPPDVEPLLRRACFDCHSNETRWPWYGSVAPASWLVHRDVVDGRKHLNFSTWGTLPDDRRARKQRGIAKAVASGEMPMWFYVPLHPEAKLTPDEKERISAWARGPVAPVDAIGPGP